MPVLICIAVNGGSCTLYDNLGNINKYSLNLYSSKTACERAAVAAVKRWSKDGSSYSYYCLDVTSPSLPPEVPPSRLQSVDTTTPAPGDPGFTPPARPGMGATTGVSSSPTTAPATIPPTAPPPGGVAPLGPAETTVATQSPSTVAPPSPGSRSATMEFHPGPVPTTGLPGPVPHAATIPEIPASTGPAAPVPSDSGSTPVDVQLASPEPTVAGPAATVRETAAPPPSSASPAEQGERSASVAPLPPPKPPAAPEPLVHPTGIDVKRGPTEDDVAREGHRLPWFITTPGSTDYLLVAMAGLLIAVIIAIGNLFFKLHALPERWAHKANPIQLELVAVLSLLALFTHQHVFWVAALLLAMIRFPDFASPLQSMADSLASLTRGAGARPRGKTAVPVGDVGVEGKPAPDPIGGGV